MNKLFFWMGILSPVPPTNQNPFSLSGRKTSLLLLERKPPPPHGTPPVSGTEFLFLLKGVYPPPTPEVAFEDCPLLLPPLHPPGRNLFSPKTLFSATSRSFLFLSFFFHRVFSGSPSVCEGPPPFLLET